MKLSKKFKDATFLALVFGTLTWFFLACLFFFFMPAELFDPKLWAAVILIDIACILLVVFTNVDVSYVNSFTTSISLMQITYYVHSYDMHMVYLFFMLGTFSATINSLIGAEKIHLYLYGAVTFFCAASILFHPAPFSLIISLGLMAGALFSIVTTLVNKKVRDENLVIKIELTQAKKYAHEINSPLLVVKGRIGQVIKRGKHLEPSDIEKLLKADENIDRISKIVKLVG